mmetsp:Transcript_107102/g.341808  ORF Transcript_107102/g.341808 Transcript_107102/m.341808 type:complete len:116 (+) Transcript_107102:774-1121(+)
MHQFAHTPLEWQIRTVAQTAVFIAGHGGGLSHMVFLAEFALVVEIGKREAPCYKNVANTSGFSYAFNAFSKWHEGMARFVGNFYTRKAPLECPSQGFPECWVSPRAMQWKPPGVL